MHKFREIILGNFPIKLLSFTVAIVLWFITMNVNNPTIEKDITVPITFKNEALIYDQGFVIVNLEDLQSTTIQVKYRGKRNDVESYRKYTDAIVATLDFSNIDLSNESLLGKEISVPVTVSSNYPSTFTITTSYPISVFVKIDTLATKTVPVYANIEGQPKNTYVLQGSPSLSKTSVTLTGPKSTLDKITKVNVNLSVEGADTDVIKAVTPIALDADSNNLSQYVYSGLDEIKVTQKIAKATTLEIIAPSLIGELPDGYFLLDYTTNLNSIDVFANESNENLSFNPIVLDSISLENITEDTVFKEDITTKLLEQGLKVKKSEDAIITTTIYVEKEINTTIDIPIKEVIFSDVEYDYTVKEDFVTLSIKAPKSVADTLSPEDFDIVCNLNNTITTTEYLGILQVTTPANVTLLEQPTVHITLNLTDNVTEEPN